MPATPFLGRARELAELTALLRSVTVVLAGGPNPRARARVRDLATPVWRSPADKTPPTKDRASAVELLHADQ
jgi:hypothetical protein